MEQKIDKWMAAYSNKFSAPGIDVDTVTQMCGRSVFFTELRATNHHKDR